MKLRQNARSLSTMITIVQTYSEDQAYLSAEVGRIPMHDKVSLTVVGHADRTAQNDIIIIYLLREPLVFIGFYLSMV